MEHNNPVVSGGTLSQYDMTVVLTHLLLHLAKKPAVRGGLYYHQYIELCKLMSHIRLPYMLMPYKRVKALFEADGLMPLEEIFKIKDKRILKMLQAVSDEVMAQQRHEVYVAVMDYVCEMTGEDYITPNMPRCAKPPLSDVCLEAARLSRHERST